MVPANKPPQSRLARYTHEVEPPIRVHIHTIEGLIDNLNEKGKATNVSPSSAWLPVSVSPGTIVSVPVVNVYWQLRGVAVGVAVAVAVAEGEAVGVGDGVAPTTLNAPILNCHPAPLVVGTSSLMYQKVVSSVGSITIDV